jgi:hypothetical protein
MPGIRNGLFHQFKIKPTLTESNFVGVANMNRTHDNGTTTRLANLFLSKSLVIRGILMGSHRRGCSHCYRKSAAVFIYSELSKNLGLP